MRISVRSRPGRNGKEPCSFCLGRSELHIVDIIARSEAGDARRFQVRVADGRRFVIRHQPALDRWELAAVHGPGGLTHYSGTSSRARANAPRSPPLRDR